MANRRISADDAQQFIRYVTELATEGLIEELRKQAAEKAEYVPEGLLSSISGKVVGGAKSDIVAAAIKLLDAGRNVEMRRMTYSRRPITKDSNFILEWARKHSKRIRIGKVPGYKDASNLTQEQKIERIAGAIIASRGNREYVKRQRAKTWRYARTAYAFVGRLQADLIRRQAEYFNEVLAGELKSAVGDQPIVF